MRGHIHVIAAGHERQSGNYLISGPVGGLRSVTSAGGAARRRQGCDVSDVCLVGFGHSPDVAAVVAAPVPDVFVGTGAFETTRRFCATSGAVLFRHRRRLGGLAVTIRRIQTENCKRSDSLAILTRGFESSSHFSTTGWDQCVIMEAAMPMRGPTWSVSLAVGS